MRIERIHIDGFGTLVDRSYGPIDRPMTIMCGPNEVGKTTLLAFIRHILFGFPPGNARENRYVLDDTGRHGGRLHIAMDEGGRYTIGRQRGRTAAGAVTVTAEDGTTLDGVELPRLLGHASRPLFESLFAFDLGALASFKVAAGAEIASRLYGAGVGVARLPDVLRDIERGRDALFMPRGRNQPVAEVLGQLEDIEMALRVVQDQASEYRRLSQELKDTNDQIAQLDTELTRLGTRRQELAKWAAAWDTWIDLRNVRRRLEGLPELEGFPEEAIPRLEHLDERLRDAREAVTTTSEKLQEAQDEAASPIPNETLLARASEIETIREQRGAFIASIRDLPERQAEARAEASRLEEDLRALGTGWTEQRLLAFDISIARRDEVNQWQGRLETSERDRRDREMVAEGLHADLADAERRGRELEAEFAQAVQQVAAKPHRLPAAMQRFSLPALLSLGGLAAAAAGALINAPVLLGLGVGAAIAGILIAAYLFGFRPGFPAPTPRLDDGRLAEALRATELLRERVRGADGARDTAGRQADALNVQWTNWLRTNGMPPTLTPGGARDFLTRLETARLRVADVREREDRADAIQHDIDQYRSVVTPVADEAGITWEADHQSIVEASSEVIAEYEAARTAEQQRRAAKSAAAERGRDVVKAERGMAALRADYDALLAAGKTGEPEDFRRLAAQHEERQELERREQEFVDGLHRVLGAAAQLVELDRVLAVTSLDAIEAELTDVDGKLAEVGGQRDGLHNRRGERSTDLARLQGDEEASRLRTRRASLVDQLHAHARDWSRFAVARALLDRTRQRYERERQPAVLARASAYFADLTEGRYRRVYQPLDGQGLRVVEKHDGVRPKSPEELSRGTREQLYLALRFAAVEEFGERQERLPVIVDEVLVNFDPKRARKAAGAFATVAKQNQVIVFTCHPWLRDVFLEALPDAGIISLT